MMKKRNILKQVWKEIRIKKDKNPNKKRKENDK